MIKQLTTSSTWIKLVSPGQLSRHAQGFNFLGHTVRKYGDKLLTKPSKSNVKALLATTAVMDNRDDFGAPLDLTPPLRRLPFSSYGQSKLRAEEFLRAESAGQGFPLSIVRLCTVYGPHPRPNTLFDILKRQVARETLASQARECIQSCLAVQTEVLIRKLNPILRGWAN